MDRVEAVPVRTADARATVDSLQTRLIKASSLIDSQEAIEPVLPSAGFIHPGGHNVRGQNIVTEWQPGTRR